MASRFVSSGVEFPNSLGPETLYKAPDFTNPSGAAIVLSCVFANLDGSVPVDISATILQGGTPVSQPASVVEVPAAASLDIVSNKYVLTSGQELRGLVSASGGISVTTSVLEIYG